MFDKIFDTVPILQNLVASALFLVGYWLCKKIVFRLRDLVNVFSIKKRREALLLRKIHLKNLLSTTTELNRIAIATATIYTALNRFFVACVYIVFGLISESYFSHVSWIPFCIAVAYLFLAMQAVVMDTSPVDTSDDLVQKKLDEIDVTINMLDEKERTIKTKNEA